ncbi:IS1182 family transposase [Pseudolysobacter antarcticus]|uniref:IS1182 family transposase n=1 Tax=Pseudolysobacter antarcticus TaxID=2511995 RepID=A0A411HNI3_9GAMM|nr:IS1182 family transposase [Pseudolysobacter antarcticus]QBB72028.1 IS1182 family transposase [Pseudolysobacter antarcticus]QBB72039.1 IS1182 family transposase [Pseudolysobacter antarcticus]QBB72041.1 IS1182 family transposase [Pseudolysobacter antarcticus]QBB72330.1 IS1182 family transposase [Pseudolysobacter antarcticus]QBB72332.1 IS1182 family transposase [Pseudolysobacter antarcticus]
MARYKVVDMSPRLLPVDLEAQLLPGSFAHAVHHVVDALDLSLFDAHYRNDEVGASAHAPAMLLKAVLLAYSQGMISSRAIERACRDNVVFIAITGDAKPHFTTIADFVSRSRDAIASVFGQVLTLLGKEGLIGRTMFAIDGVKLPSNASKHRSGTRAEFLAQAQKMERAAKTMLDRHQANDAGSAETVMDAKATARIERLTKEAAKLRTWLIENPTDRAGTRGSIRKSNRTDNASAKLATDKGVIQGYCGVAVVDAAHQVIVEASAHGTGSEQELLLPVLDACAYQRNATTLITADAGYHCEANLAALAERGIDALIADNQMRRRDERFAEQGKHTSKPDPLYDKSRRAKKPRLFGSEDFIIAADHSHAICPAGQRLYRNGKDCTIGSYAAIKFRAPAATCEHCTRRAQCLRKPETTPARQVAVLTRKAIATHTQRMRERIDSDEGREQYGRRFATVEPVFGNLRHNKRLNRFTLRGQTKVDGQWKLFALVHNIEKWANYRKAA